MRPTELVTCCCGAWRDIVLVWTTEDRMVSLAWKLVAGNPLFCLLTDTGGSNLFILLVNLLFLEILLAVLDGTNFSG